MGTLFYGAGRLEIPFDDRVLAHLQIVMIAKLRRTEGFMLSWENRTGRSMVWVTPSTDLQFEFTSRTAPGVNRDWLDRLAAIANTAHGLYVTPEGDLEPLTEAASSGGQ